MKVNVYITDGFETMEALSPVDIFRRAGFEVDIVSCKNNSTSKVHNEDKSDGCRTDIEMDKRVSELTVKSAQNVLILADRLFAGENEEKADVYFLPGGPGWEALKNTAGLKEVFLKAYEDEKYILAICAAPAILGEWGILGGKQAICYPGFEDKLKGASVKVNPVKVVRDGRLITARGPGVSVDIALEAVKAIKGEEAACNLARELQFIG